MQDLDWNDLRYVLAVARAETLSGAARRLAVDETTVARRLRRLERILGARLFERSGGLLRPTASGEEAVAQAERMEHAVDAVRGGLGGRDSAVSGTVRLTTVPIVADRILVPALPAFFARHPELRLELIADARDLSLTRREADVALRLARPRGEGAVLARRVGRLPYRVYAPVGVDPDDAPWLTYDETMSDLPQARWIAAAADRGGTVARLRVNDAEALAQAVAAGLGRALLPAAVGDALAGVARTIGAGPPTLHRELWLLVHPELRDLARVRAVVDWLAELAGRLDA